MLESVYHELGEEGLTKLVATFYRRVRVDDVIGPMYPPDDWENAEKRLRDFLIYRFGGSDLYIRERGHPRLRGRHMPFSIGEAERDRWLLLMSESARELELNPEVYAVMMEFFAQIADFMRNQPG